MTKEATTERELFLNEFINENHIPNLFDDDWRMLQLFGDARDEKTWCIWVHRDGRYFVNADRKRRLKRTIDTSTGRYVLGIPYWTTVDSNGKPTDLHTKMVYCYRCVANAFCPNERKLTIVHHINGISTDDRFQNLLFVTREEHTHLHSILRKAKNTTDANERKALIDEYNENIWRIRKLNKGETV